MTSAIIDPHGALYGFRLESLDESLTNVIGKMYVIDIFEYAFNHKYLYTFVIFTKKDVNKIIYIYIFFYDYSCNVPFYRLRFGCDFS